MKQKKPSKVSIREIARVAGISNAAASYALQNKPEVSRATRERVLRIARRLGYAPDARLASWMARVRETKAKDFLPIAWLNTHKEKDAWHKYKWLSPCLEGARERSLQLGYRLEEIWLHQPGMTMRRIAQMLRQQGIEGIILSMEYRAFRFDWDHLAGVCIGGGTVAPRLHRVGVDIVYNFLLAIKMLKRSGYQRIGICLQEDVDRRTHHAIRAMTHDPEVMGPKLKRVPPFFYLGGSNEGWRIAKKQVATWLRRHQPDAIVGYSGKLVQWVEEAGYRVPEDISVVHLATDDDVSDWAGIFSNKRAIAAAAVELVISLMQNRQFGVPKTALHTIIQGAWHPGRTLLIPKPK